MSFAAEADATAKRVGGKGRADGYLHAFCISIASQPKLPARSALFVPRFCSPNVSPLSLSLLYRRLLSLDLHTAAS